MFHTTTVAEFTAEPPKPVRGSSSPPRQLVSKQLRGMQRLYEKSSSLYNQSHLSDSLETMLRARNQLNVTKAISLGLGSLSEKSRDQPRRFKQLAIFLAIADHLRQALSPRDEELGLELYAQDPTFTKADESFLQSLGIHILRTPSPSDLGEARHVIDRNTLVYSPFLTINAYGLLLKSCPVELLIGDDFNSLLLKWDKHTTEHKDVVQLAKLHISQYQRRVVAGNGFWDEDDRAFPMALYRKKPGRQQKDAVVATRNADVAMHDIAYRLAKARL